MFLTYFELSEDVDDDPAVEHWLAVDRCDEVRNLLKGQRRDLLHYLHSALIRRSQSELCSKRWANGTPITDSNYVFLKWPINGVPFHFKLNYHGYSASIYVQ